MKNNPEVIAPLDKLKQMLMPKQTHKQWLDNEYSEWVKALQESTVHNFKEHPVVKRMLGEPDKDVWKAAVSKYDFPLNTLKTIIQIDQIGRKAPLGYCSWAGVRYCYYAFEILKLNPSSICEIGGGVGQFYAILRALGWKGEYQIVDHAQVAEFQDKYLAEVMKQTGLNTLQKNHIEPDFVCSFYALGEFDDQNKEWYRSLINSIPHGYIAWNPHSGASDDLSLFKHDIKVTDGIEPGIKIITW